MIGKVKSKIEDEPTQKMRYNFLELIEIGDVLGCDHLETEMGKAVDVVGSLKNS